jgi:hypothetical protein
LGKFEVGAEEVLYGVVFEDASVERVDAASAAKLIVGIGADSAVDKADDNCHVAASAAGIAKLVARYGGSAPGDYVDDVSDGVYEKLVVAELTAGGLLQMKIVQKFVDVLFEHIVRGMAD